MLARSSLARELLAIFMEQDLFLWFVFFLIIIKQHLVFLQYVFFMQVVWGLYSLVFEPPPLLKSAAMLKTYSKASGNTGLKCRGV